MTVATFSFSFPSHRNKCQVFFTARHFTPPDLQLTPFAIPTVTPSPIATLPPTRTPRPTEIPLLTRTDITYTHSLHPNVNGRALDIYAPEYPGEWPVIILAHGPHDNPVTGFKVIKISRFSQMAEPRQIRPRVLSVIFVWEGR